MADMILTNQTSNDYTFGPYHLPAGSGQNITIDTTTSASLYLIDDAFTDIVNQLVAGGQIVATNTPTPFPRVTGVPQLLHGDGSPEGVHFAPSGSAFMRRDNSGANNSLYAKTTGPSLSTGWQAFAGAVAPTPATTLPGSPSNAQQAILVDSTSAPTYAWLLQYSTAATKWLCIGGSTALVEVTTQETPGSNNAYVALTTAGPSFTVPRAGDYYVTVGANILASGNLSGQMSYDIGGTGAVDADSTFGQSAAATGGGDFSRTRIKTGLAASTALVAKYKQTGAGVNFSNRFIAVIPRSVT